MITATTAWTQGHYRLDGNALPIIRLVDESAVSYYFSTTAISLTDVTGNKGVFPYLLPNITYSESIDIFRKTWSVSDLVFDLQNATIARSTAGTPTSLSSVAAVYNPVAAYLYWLVGNATALTDCILAYAGVVEQQPSYNESTIHIVAVTSERAKTVLLPTTVAGDTYSDALETDKTKRIPIVYGEFTKDWAWSSDTGLARTVCIDKGDGSMAKWAVADHAIHTLSQDYVKHPNLPDPSAIYNSTLDNDDSGAATIQFTDGTGDNEVRMTSYLYPRIDTTGTDRSAYTGGVYYYLSDWKAKVTDYNHIMDRDLSTYAAIKDSIDTGMYFTAPGYFNITTATNASPIHIQTSTSHGFSNGDTVIVQGCRGNTAANGVWVINNVSGGIYFDLIGSTGNGTYATGTGDVGLLPLFTVTGATNATPIQITTSVTHSYATGQAVTVWGVGGNTAANGSWFITNTGLTTFTLDDSVGNGTYSSGGYVSELDDVGYMRFYCPLMLGNYDNGDWLVNSIGRMGAGGTPYIRIKISNPYGEYTSDQCALWLTYGAYTTAVSSAAITMNSTEAAVSMASLTSYLYDAGWHFLSGIDTTGTYPFVFLVTGQTVLNSAVSSHTNLSGGFLNDLTIANVYSARFEIPSTLFEPTKYPLFAACKGRACGSWLNGRGYNTYATGDCITDAAYIVESILRDEMAVTTADIDTTSFDDADSIGPHFILFAGMRVNIHDGNKGSSAEIISRICQQSPFAFAWCANGTMKLIPTDATSWTDATVDRTIRWEWLCPNGVEVLNIPPFANRISIDSRHLPEYGDNYYHDHTTVNDTTSQSLWGIREWSGKWPFLSGTSVTGMAAHLVAASTGVWSTAHDGVKFRTMGTINADLQVGDIVALDSTPADYQLKYRGNTSWSGLKFLVTGVTQTLDVTELTTLRLYNA